MTELRPLVAADVPTLAAIHAAAFGPHAWTTTMFADSLRSVDVWGLLLVNATQPVGFALCQQIGGDCEILTFAILPPQQQRGLGRHMLQALYDAAKARQSSQIFLEVAADNILARRLYTGFGFKLAGARPGYYPRPGGAVEALLMHMNIQGS